MKADRSMHAAPLGVALVVALFFAVAGCGGGSNNPQVGDIQSETTIYIFPQQVACEKGVAVRCLLIRDHESELWEPYHSYIAGFEFEPGFTWALKVNRIPSNDPRWQSGARYSLNKVLEKNPSPVGQNENYFRRIYGVEWILQSGNVFGRRVTPIPNRPISITFRENGLMEGLSGCNHFNAAYALLPTGEFNITKIGASIETCPEPGIQEQERRYLQALEGATRIEYDRQALHLRFSNSTGVLTYLAGRQFD